jgi:hypothetical protein
MADVARKPKQDVAYAVAAGTLLNAIMAIGIVMNPHVNISQHVLISSVWAQH